MWEQDTINSPTIETAKFKDVYKDKHNVSHEEGYGNVKEMANWIWGQLEDFWHRTSIYKEETNL